MKCLTESMLFELVSNYLSGQISFNVIREFVFEYYEAETNFCLSKCLEIIFPELLIYLQCEEAFGDELREKRMENFVQVIKLSVVTREHVVFALNFDQIKKYVDKLDNNVITVELYEKILEKISPLKFDLEIVSCWAKSHKGLEAVDVSKMI